MEDAAKFKADVSSRGIGTVTMNGTTLPGVKSIKFEVTAGMAPEITITFTNVDVVADIETDQIKHLKKGG